MCHRCALLRPRPRMGAALRVEQDARRRRRRFPVFLLLLLLLLLLLFSRRPPRARRRRVCGCGDGTRLGVQEAQFPPPHVWSRARGCGGSGDGRGRIERAAAAAASERPRGGVPPSPWKDEECGWFQRRERDDACRHYCRDAGRFIVSGASFSFPSLVSRRGCCRGSRR